MPTVSTQIEIAVPPEKVRDVFLDFASYSEWSHAFVKSVSPKDRKDPKTLQVGDTVDVELTNMKFSSKITGNTEEEFKWQGSVPLLFTGEHSWRFQSSETTPGQTLVVQQEVFTGLLSFLLGENWSMGKNTKKNFEAFNRDLKARAESLQAPGAQTQDLEARAEAFRRPSGQAED
ncbi:MAG: hypothetical protein Q9162_005527 [Coniocarpon cinnabarinum]